jgi:hypothetical protein
MSVATGAVDPTMTASVDGTPAASSAASGVEQPLAEPAPVAVANAPAAAASDTPVVDPPPAQVEVAPVAPAAAASEAPLLPVPDLRDGEEAAPAPAEPPAIAAKPPTPAPAEAPAAVSVASDPAAAPATLEERMFVESAPVDPNVANSYATAEEGGLTGLVLRLYQQEQTPEQ